MIYLKRKLKRLKGKLAAVKRLSVAKQLDVILMYKHVFLNKLKAEIYNFKNKYNSNQKSHTSENM
jgi:hypothetical protein